MLSSMFSYFLHQVVQNVSQERLGLADRNSPWAVNDPPVVDKANGLQLHCITTNQGSSNGKTSDFGSENAGSSPAP